MTKSFLSILIIGIIVPHKAMGDRCGNNFTLTSDITIDITDVNSFTSSISSAGAGSNTVVLENYVIIPSGYTLTITGSSTTQLKVKIKPALGFKVEKGGLLIIEYCDITEQGSCSEPLYNNTTWDGILVEGNPNKEHYSTYDLTNGWDPYASTFVPGGTYTTNAGGSYSHGRLQMRWCSVKDIHWEDDPAPTSSDDVNTTYVNEGKFGNYAIRSTEGGILNIIDCDFEDVRTAILIDNFEQYATADPSSRLMNAFQIIDCDFTVTADMRDANATFKHCIELYKAQKVTLEGCTFSSTGSESFNTGLGVAIYMELSSLMMHKGGNFRRTSDVWSSGSEGRVGCLKYGNEQSVSGYPTDHPWRTSGPRKCTFDGFFRGIESTGSTSNFPLHTLVVDDLEFTETFFPIYCQDNISVTISRSSFSFTQVNADYSNEASVEIFDDWGNGLNRGIGASDRIDICLHGCRNSLVTECDFSSDYNGKSATNPKSLYIILDQILGGNFDKGNYDLIYKNTFDPGNTQTDVGVWITRWDNNAHVLLNCNTFEDLDNAVYIGRKATSLTDQFHYTDIDNGRNAPALNTFTNNTCDFNADTYNGTTSNYFRKVSEIFPNHCSSGVITDVTSSEDPGCDGLTCERFPMTFIEDYLGQNDISIYPNPSTGVIQIRHGFASEHLTLNIYDLSGKRLVHQLLKSKSPESTLQTALSEGIYYLTLSDGSSTTMSKIVIVTK